MYKQKRNFGALVCSLIAGICALFGVGRVFQDIPVGADSTYLSVAQADFTFKQVYNSGKWFIIELEYNGESLPQCGGYDSYETVNVPLKTDDEDVLNLSSVSENGSKTSILLYIPLTYDKDGRIGYKAASPTEITIPAGTVLISNCESAYVGISFITDLTLYKVSDMVWTTEQPIKSYGIELNEDNAFLAWDEEEKCLSAKITVPYIGSVGEVYETVFENYEGETLVKQTSSTEITIYYKDTEALQATEDFASFTLPLGVFTSKNLAVKLTLAGEIVFHKYIDGSWDTEQYICIQETVNGAFTEQKLSASSVYILPTVTETAEKVFVGWESGGTLIPAGKEIVLSDCSSPVFAYEAVFIEYNLIEGASVRLDTALASSGIRFGAVLDMDGAAQWQPFVVGMGMIVMPTDMIGEDSFVLENYNREGQAEDFFVSADKIAFELPSFTLYGSIVKVLEKNYNRAFSARAYVLVQQGDEFVYVWDEYIHSSSVYEVAQKAYQDDIKQWEKNILECYMNGVLDISNAEAGATLVGIIENKLVKLISCTVDRQVVTVVLETEKESIPCVSYNGKRIKNANQTYQDGCLRIQFQEV